MEHSKNYLRWGLFDIQLARGTRDVSVGVYTEAHYALGARVISLVYRRCVNMVLGAALSCCLCPHSSVGSEHHPYKVGVTSSNLVVGTTCFI